MKTVTQTRKNISKAERIVGTAVLATLMIIAVCILRIQRDINPAVFPVPAAKSTGRIARPTPGFQPNGGHVMPMPAGMIALGPVETFTPSNLSNKINGKAELYLSAGFVRLVCRRFKLSDKSDLWMEIQVYDMGTPVNAYSVYSTQRRDGAIPVEMAMDAYQTANALFMVHGRYDVEIIASRAGDAADDGLKRLASAFIRKAGTASATMAERDLFPESNRVPGSISLLSTDVFGFDRLDHVFTARYRFGETEVTAFLSRRKTPREAMDLAEAYSAFLLAFGGKKLAPSKQIPGAVRIEILGAVELIFTHGTFLAGIHEAETSDLAGRLAAALNARLKETAHAD